MRKAGDADLVIGVDTHLDTHTAAVCDGRGRALTQLQVPATTAGYQQLLASVRALAAGSQVIWAIEGTRHYGLGLARYLTSDGAGSRDRQRPPPRQAPHRQERPDRRPARGPRAARQPAPGPDAL